MKKVKSKKIIELLERELTTKEVNSFLINNKYLGYKKEIVSMKPTTISMYGEQLYKVVISLQSL